MKSDRKLSTFFIFSVIFVIGIFFLSSPSTAALQAIKIFIDGKEIQSDVDPVIMNSRTMVPVRVISEGLGMQVDWDEANRWVIIESGASKGKIDNGLTIMGDSVASSEAMRTVLKRNNPSAPDLVDLYLEIGKKYGIRGDIAFCQAAKETGWWKFGGLVKPEQNNYCGLSATGKAATADEDLRGADPQKVWFEEGKHGAFFASPAIGVEAHIQHLYAYASTKPLPAGQVLYSPRFELVNRGAAKIWIDLGGKWACPGHGYGESILDNYYKQILVQEQSSTQNSRLEQLEIENLLLKIEISRLNYLLK